MIAKDDQFILQYLMGDDTLLEEQEDSVEFHFIANLDDTLRWVYPSNTKKPHFLNFYSTSSIRAKVLCNVIKLLFFLKQSNRVKSGALNLQISETSRLSEILEKYEYIGFSIFTGTVGENRKALIEIHDNKKTFIFVKIALNESSIKLVNNEMVQLEYLDKFNFLSLVVPKVINSTSDGIVELTNIKPRHYHQSSKITKTHVRVLSELYSQSHRQGKWNELSALRVSKLKINELLNGNKIINPLEKERVLELCNNVLSLIKMLEKEEKSIPLSIAHGDFTPWNMYISNDTLYLFDWELSQREMPLMVDHIHFVFLSEIMIRHAGYKAIHSELEGLLKLPSVQVLIKDFDIDFNKHYMFYLIYTISYYLKKYVKQEKLHEQVFWIFDSWENAVADLLNKKGTVFH